MLTTRDRTMAGMSEADCYADLEARERCDAAAAADNVCRLIVAVTPPASDQDRLLARVLQCFAEHATASADAAPTHGLRKVGAADTLTCQHSVPMSKHVHLQGPTSSQL